jgi:hypothetical protein
VRIIAAALAALTLAACTPPAQEETPTGEPSLPGVTLPVADRAGNRMEALIENGGAWCTSGNALGAEDTRCVSLQNGEWWVSFGAVGGRLPVTGDGEVSVWPVVISSSPDAAFYVGLVQTGQQIYSGGGGSAARVTIYEVAGTDPGYAAAPTVTLPLNGQATVRACFDEADEATRAGACHDEYRFVSRISLDEGASSGAPVIILETAAGSFPGPLTRTQDSAERGPLTEDDLVWARDETCSFRRTYTRQTDGLYAPDQPLPGCADYLEP